MYSSVTKLIRSPVMKLSIVSIVTLLLLLVLWPNLIHEPLHIVALELQGSSGVIEFDWKFPIAPVTHRVLPLAGVAGGMLYLLLPSIFSLTIIFGAIVTRRYAGVVTHILLPTYLTYDLLLNIIHYANPFSDFRFIVLMPWLMPLLVTTILSIGCITLSLNMFNAVKKYKKFTVEGE